MRPEPRKQKMENEQEVPQEQQTGKIKRAAHTERLAYYCVSTNADFRTGHLSSSAKLSKLAHDPTQGATWFSRFSDTFHVLPRKSKEYIKKYTFSFKFIKTF